MWQVLAGSRWAAVRQSCVRLAQPRFRRGREWLAVLASALAWMLMFPRNDWGWLAWCALVPLSLAVQGVGAWRAACYGGVFGLLSVAGVLYWVFEAPGFFWFHGLASAVYLALYPALWSVWLANGKLERRSTPLLGACVWLLLDVLKNHAGFLAMPWAEVAQSQHAYPVLLQLASVIGESGLGLLIVFCNLLLARACWLRSGRQLLLPLLLLLAIAGFGAIRLSLGGLAGTPWRVAVVQPCMWPEDLPQAAGQQAARARLWQMTEQETAGPERPALVVWPETALVGLQRDLATQRRLRLLTDQLNFALLTGTSEHFKFHRRGDEGGMQWEYKAHNAAWLFDDGKLRGPPYLKQRLVPFGEYQPLAEWIRWPAWWVGKQVETVPGQSPVLFQTSDALRFGVLICWESLFADLARLQVKQGATLLVNLVNDAWFGRSAAGRQHNMAAVLRAVENGVPVLVASNTGPSQLIDAYGRVVATRVDDFSPGVLQASLPAALAPTLYRHLGEQWLWGIAALLLPFEMVARWLLRRGRYGARCGQEGGGG